MLMRSDPFNDVDRAFARLFQNTFGGETGSREASMPVDAWREGDAFFLALDLPGIDGDSIDVDIDRNVLTVRAQRPPLPAKDTFVSERHHGAFARRFVLGDMLDLDAVKASYVNGVLTLRVPVAERAKPRKISIDTGLGTDDQHRVVEAAGTPSAQSADETSAVEPAAR